MAVLTFDNLPDPPPTSGATPPTGTGALTFDQIIGTPEQQASEQRKKKLYDLAMAVRAAQDRGTFGSAMDIGGNAFLANLAKPINAAMDVAVGKTRDLLGTSDVPGATAGELWSASTNAFDDQLAEAQRKAGGYGTAANIAGSLASPVNYIAPEALLGRMALGTGIGAAQGAAERSNSWSDALSGALKGGAAGGATVGTLGVLPTFGSGLLRGGAGAARDQIGELADKGLWPSIWGGLTLAYGGAPLHVAAAGPAAVAAAKLAKPLLDRGATGSFYPPAAAAAPAAVETPIRDLLARILSQGTGTYASNVVNSGGRSPY